MKYLGIDIGGTFIKGAVIDALFFKKDELGKYPISQIEKIISPLHKDTKPRELIEALEGLMLSLKIESKEIKGIGISIAGIVSYKGSKVSKAASHLNVLRSEEWKVELEKQFQYSINLMTQMLLLSDWQSMAI